MQQVIAIPRAQNAVVFVRRDQRDDFLAVSRGTGPTGTRSDAAAGHDRDAVAATVDAAWHRRWTPGKPTVFLATAASEFAPMFSQDGRFIAYSSNEAGSGIDVYVRPFRDRRRTRPAGTYNPLRTSMRRVTAPDTIALDEIRDLARTRFGDMIKGVVDLERGIMLLDADLHADQEATLLADGSKQANLWGINLYPDVAGDDWLECDSMINLRPSFGNRSRSVDDAGTRAAIAALIARMVRR